MNMRMPKWLSTMTVAAAMFAQTAGMAVRAPARAPEPVRAQAAQQTAVFDRAPDRAPDRAEQTLRVSVRVQTADRQAERAGGGETAEQRTIVIDPGHGGTDPGAVHEANGQTDLKEEDVTLAVSQKLAEMLRAQGYDVKLTREADVDIAPGEAASLQARVNIANEADADLLISAHFNGLNNHNTRGTEVWYCADRPFSGENEKLAKAVQESLVRNLRNAGYDTEDRGIKDDARMGHFAITGPHMAHPSEMPSIIGEPLFMTNDQDAEQMKRPEMQEALARGYFEGIQAYFGNQ